MSTSITGQGISIYPAPDDALSSTSKNPVQNKVIDEEITDVKNAISQLEGNLGEYNLEEIAAETSGYIKTNVDVIDPTPVIVGSGGYKHSIIPCVAGDRFIAYGKYLGTAADLYVFTNAEYEVLDRSPDTADMITYNLVAPTDASYLIVQRNNYSPNEFWKGAVLSDDINDLIRRVGTAEQDIDALKSEEYFSQNLDGWVNKGIAPATGNITANAKRLMTEIPYTAISCNVDSGYSFLVFGWSGNTYLGWYTGTTWSKDSMVLRTEELDLSGIRNNTLYAVLIHGTTVNNAVNIDVSEGLHFFTKNKTDTLLATKNAPADAYATGLKIASAKLDTENTVTTITGNSILVPTVSGYIKTDVSPVDISTVIAVDNLYHAIYPCQSGELFTVKGVNPGLVANYCVFVDSSYNVLRRESVYNVETIIEAPTDSAYIIIQRNVHLDNNLFIRGKFLQKVINDISTEVEYLATSIGGYRSPLYYAADDSQPVVTNYDALIAMYDALVTTNPDYITKNTLTHGTFTNYEYVFTMGARNSGNGQRSKDSQIAKPVVLLMAGVHGHERCSIMGLYLFAKALCESPELSPLRNGLTVKMIPVVCPSGYNNNTRVNANGVNINRNFDANWVLTPDDGMNYSGASPADQDETQVVQDWFAANTDAIIEIDWHNSAFVNEICYFATCIADGFAVAAKKGYFYGLDRITGHWINDRGITDDGVIYGYTGVDAAAGTSYAYAKKLNVKGCLFETSWNVSDYGKDTNATIGVNAEAFCAAIKGIYTKYIDEA